MDPPALKAAETADEIGRDGRIGVPEMGDVVNVVDGCGQVKDLFAHVIVWVPGSVRLARL
jgi:hypothetical protein